MKKCLRVIKGPCLFKELYTRIGCPLGNASDSRLLNPQATPIDRQSGQYWELFRPRPKELEAHVRASVFHEIGSGPRWSLSRLGFRVSFASPRGTHFINEDLNSGLRTSQNRVNQPVSKKSGCFPAPRGSSCDREAG